MEVYITTDKHGYICCIVNGRPVEMQTGQKYVTYLKKLFTTSN